MIFISSRGFTSFSVLSFLPAGLSSAFLARVRSNGNELPQLSFIWKCLNFSLTSEGQFWWILDSWLKCFYFSVLNIPVHCFWPPKVSHEKSAGNFIEDPMYVIPCFSLDTSVFLCLSFESLIIIRL